MYDLPFSVFCRNCGTYGRPTKEQTEDKAPYRCHKCGNTWRPFSGKEDRLEAPPYPD